MLAVPFSVFHSDINSVYARLKQRRADDEISPRVSPPSWEFFAQAQGSSVENDDANGTPTFDFDTYGVLVGADCKVDDDFVVGVALGYERGTADIHNSGGDIDIDDFHTIAFFGKDIGNAGFINGGVQFGHSDYEATRRSFYGKSTGDSTGYNLGVFVDAGWKIEYTDTFSATPHFGLSYSHAHVDDFDESGEAGRWVVLKDTNDDIYVTTGGRSLGIRSFSGDSLRMRFGFSFDWRFHLAETVGRFGLDFAYSHDFLGDEADIDYSLNGKKFTATAAVMSPDVYSISPAVSFDLTESLNVYAAYTLASGTDSAISHSANVGLRYRF